MAAVWLPLAVIRRTLTVTAVCSKVSQQGNCSEVERAHGTVIAPVRCGGRELNMGREVANGLEADEDEPRRATPYGVQSDSAHVPNAASDEILFGVLVARPEKC
ncbi:unnamed protein product, partial [Iphiclides podalirius]